MTDTSNRAYIANTFSTHRKDNGAMMPPVMTAGLSKTKRELLRLVATWDRPEPPTRRVLALAMGFTAEAAVRYHLESLEAEGYTARQHIGKGFPALDRATAKGRAVLGLPNPLPEIRLLGHGTFAPIACYPVPCGPMAVADREPTYIESFAELFENFAEGDYIMVAEGDSMVSSDPEWLSIHAGDRCHVRPCSMPSNGSITHVEYVSTEGVHEVTLKRFFVYSDSGLVTLQPHNPRYPVIELPGESVVVRGVVLDVIHRVKRGRI